MGRNLLSGNIPPEFGKLQKLRYLSLAVNNLSGSIPKEVGQLSSLESLYLYVNHFSGSIPSELGNLSRLHEMHLGNNYLSGQIPQQLFVLPNLQSLSLSKNNLSGRLTLSSWRLLVHIDVSGNRLSGDIFPVIANCSELNYIFLDNNLFEGKISPELGLMKGLLVLSLSNNHLAGNVPASFGNLSNLMYLNLGYNRLDGSVPASLKEMTKLRLLSLKYNSLKGSLPEWVWNSKDLHVVDLSNNLFSGHISRQFSELQVLRSVPNPSEEGSQDDILWGSFDALSGNGFTSSDKTNAQFIFKGHQQDFQRLYRTEGFIDLSRNRLSGKIPSQFGLLKGLRSLNVSSNKLSGHIPPDLGSLPILESLDLSNNIQEGGQFNTLDNSSYFGNAGLCCAPLSKTCKLRNRTIGTVAREEGSKQNTRAIELAAIVIGIASFFPICTAIFFKWRCSHAPIQDATDDMEIYCFGEGLKVTEKELYNCTDGLNDTKIIGTGASSTVYRGELSRGMTVAIKKLNVEQLGTEAQRSFVEECKTLGKIKHRNLVRILVVFSNLATKMLFLQFMPNGNLDMHLHGSDMCRLSWQTRLRIASGVANALMYLHEESGVGEIVHCDLKPSNILLDQDFEAHINDFGIARLIDPELHGATLSSTFRGSLGYIAPEFAYSEKVSTKADVYSYGVVVLEMITRRKPTSTFDGEMTLREWVRCWYPSKVMEGVDDGVKENATTDQIVSLLNVGLLCTQAAPSSRPSMRQVLSLLTSIHNASH
ncbi:hypothetical protein SUGI_1067590 [Cryptomeria japonica]|nr:hypothetical protein SUGI_1067590 [Cryptomeria japonica]